MFLIYTIFQNNFSISFTFTPAFLCKDFRLRYIIILCINLEKGLDLCLKIKSRL
jgi:hypothetical protein